MVYSQSFENRANKSAAVKGLPIFHKACPGVGKGILIPALEECMDINPYNWVAYAPHALSDVTFSVSSV